MKSLLALEMLDGYTGKDDQRAIAQIVPAERLGSKLGGEELRTVLRLIRPLVSGWR